MEDLEEMEDGQHLLLHLAGIMAEAEAEEVMVVMEGIRVQEVVEEGEDMVEMVAMPIWEIWVEVEEVMEKEQMEVIGAEVVDIIVRLADIMRI